MHGLCLVCRWEWYAPVPYDCRCILVKSDITWTPYCRGAGSPKQVVRGGGGSPKKQYTRVATVKDFLNFLASFVVKDA